MSNSIEAINKALYRNIKSGNQYNKYFSAAPCKPTYLGDGVTSFGLQKIKELAKQYQDQTTGIAKVLKENTIPATVLKIKNFLFNHLQYNADGWEQHLKSPNCAWQSRQTGLDCKSYSLFASSILLNLGINHKLRKITQPGSPERWSHVYVVVPHNGKELIIDATIPYNYEVAKVKQEDLNMETKLSYYGLNGVATASALTPKSVEIATALNNFQDWLDGLERKGVSKSITDTIWFEVKKYLDKGVEPKVRIEQSYILINDKRIDFGVGLAGLGFIETLFAGSGLSDVFSGIFNGKDPNEHATKRILEPMKQNIQTKLASANSSNIGSIVTNLDWHLASTIAHETKVNSKYSKVAIPGLQQMLSALRQQYASLNPQPTSGAGQFPDYWDGGTKPLAHSGTVSYYTYQNGVGSTNLSTSNLNNTTNPNNLQPTSNSTNQTTGMSTGAIVGLSVAGLLVAYFGAKKMNII